MSRRKNKSEGYDSQAAKPEAAAGQASESQATPEGAVQTTLRKAPVRNHYAVAQLPVSPFKGHEGRSCVAVVIVQCPKNETPDVGSPKHKVIRVVAVKTIVGSRNHQVTLDAAQMDCDTLNAPPKPSAVGAGEAAAKFIRAAADSYHAPIPTDLEPDEVPTVLQMPTDVA